MDNNFCNFHEALSKNNVDVNAINVTLVLNVRHTAPADPRTEIKRIKHDELIDNRTSVRGDYAYVTFLLLLTCEHKTS